MPRPRANRQKLGIPKTAASSAVPFAKPPTPAQPTVPAGGPKSLTVKLEAADYWALRDYCTQRERETGQRVTHQRAMVMALHQLLGRRAAA
jgi:hypothetical protein